MQLISFAAARTEEVEGITLTLVRDRNLVLSSRQYCISMCHLPLDEVDVPQRTQLTSDILKQKQSLKFPESSNDELVVTGKQVIFGLMLLTFARTFCERPV